MIYSSGARLSRKSSISDTLSQPEIDFAGMRIYNFSILKKGMVRLERKTCRHAWLIMTHGNFEILEKQIRFLDSENADFFVHVDAEGFSCDHYRNAAEKSAVSFLPRQKVCWGDMTQIECELRLLEASISGKYDYYHLLSGTDVPVKTREYIEQYFSDRRGTNFIKFQSREINARNLARVRYYYPFQVLNIRGRIGRTLLRELGLLPQRILRIDRTKRFPDIVFQKGTNWFDITGELASYVLSKRDLIREVFRSTCCADEMFLQTVVVNSPFADSLPGCAFDNDFRACCRYIDWDRGSPYTFGNGDYEELIHTGPDYLFARKFDYSAAPDVVDRLFSYFGTEAEP